MTAPGFAGAGRLLSGGGGQSAVVLDSLYLVAVISAVVFGGLTQLAVALPVAAVLGLRAMHRRRGSSHPGSRAVGSRATRPSRRSRRHGHAGRLAAR